MTRARSRLVLTGAARRRIFGEYQSSQPSRFIEEVPADLLERAMGLSVPLKAEAGIGPDWMTAK